MYSLNCDYAPDVCEAQHIGAKPALRRFVNGRAAATFQGQAFTAEAVEQFLKSSQDTPAQKTKQGKSKKQKDEL